MSYDSASAVFLVALIAFMIYNVCAWTDKYYAARNRMRERKEP